MLKERFAPSTSIAEIGVIIFIIVTDTPWYRKDCADLESQSTQYIEHTNLKYNDVLIVTLIMRYIDNDGAKKHDHWIICSNAFGHSEITIHNDSY